MKKILSIIVLFFAFNLSHAQLGGEDEVYLSGDLTEATFQGGDLNKFYDYIIKNFDTKTVEKKGQLIFSFTINDKGEVKNIRVVKDLGGTSALEVIRVLRASQKWEPAKRGGKPVSIDIKLPMNFK
ncbi:energy transducer TonB [Flavobacterium facile]|uniref:energy transducer TonB n=1 Tax=Flavobacterium facile TaxID=2893174 RepID=UPI002E79E728|nr:energy transducer TonB [Flavobacterium sp. T-12]